MASHGPAAGGTGLRRATLGLRSGVARLLPVLPFFAFAVLFLILPAGSILAGAFLDGDGAFTVASFAKLLRPNIISAYRVSVELSAVTALGACAFGLVLAYAALEGGLPKGLRSFLLSFSGVASNFAGVPLAFAFIATLGRMGLVTAVLKAAFGVDLYGAGFSLYGFWGLALAYLYFQIPLMVLVISPALEALKPEWREAAHSLGASRARYWLEVGLPILAPSVLSAALLLFGNAFGAYATAYALTGGMLNLVTILIGAQIRGDVLHDPSLGYALATGMVAIMALTTVAGGALRRRASRWMS